MREQMVSQRDQLIEKIIDRDADDDLGAREAMRLDLEKKTDRELEIIWGNPDQKL